MDNSGQASPHEEILNELMDSRRSKTEHEHAAVKEITKLRAALTELSEPKGAFSMDRLTHAENIIKEGVVIAQTALGIYP